VIHRPRRRDGSATTQFDQHVYTTDDAMSICERHAAGQVSITMRSNRTLSLTVADDVLTSIPVSDGFVDSV